MKIHGRMTGRREKIDALLGREPKPKPKRLLKHEPTKVIPALLRWVAGGKTLLSFCRQPGTPTSSRIYKWLDEDPGFANEFRSARAIGYDALAEQCLLISDHGDESNVRHRKLRIWTRLQLLARWDTARYGDKILLGGHLEHSVTMTDDEVRCEVMSLLATAKSRQLTDPKNRIALLN